MKRIGIYVGTFDPVHDGHLSFADTALEICHLDKLFFLVEPVPCRKQGVKAVEHREKMVQLATSNKAQLGNIILEDTQFSVERTLPWLWSRFNGCELFMLMGDDVTARLASWTNIEDLTRHVQLVIGLRNAFSTRDTKQKVELLYSTRGFVIEYTIVRTDLPHVSSSKIRQQIKRGQKPAGLPVKVEEYIRKQRLYTSSKTGS